MAIKKASLPKSYINIKDLGFALLESEEDGTTKYSNVIQTRGLQEISVETGGELKNAYADGGIIESGNTDGEGTISLTMHAFPKEIRQLLFNEVYDENGVFKEVKGKQNNYVAVWFKRERRDGNYALVGLTKVMFADPAIEGSTAEDEWEFSQEEVEGTAMHRLNDETRKIMFQSDLEGASEDKFFDDLLQGAYTEAEEIPANTDNPDEPAEA
ncbi:major tail protein [Staphylococcus nepalensis]|uniref:Phage tail protein n=1 Tax=Staphylococcus nepalensis TaxID=214473 RepID=A0ABS3L0A4_9STAP|nr:major tail protein [Staphylococcus nepalensis]MBO1213773.1 phage tail protein [Staphylococcus nepalensis]MBO1215006.1 phage tail protein [Staphylococcus nepalensis]MBO1226962.1 phage tail protein [Staphylococcus nepalensis]MBO1234076.1 phage tail protein [Staphylococcus nepalensis]MBO1237008.1 phage tail protein [Staphylococcus nepalensis]